MNQIQEAADKWEYVYIFRIGQMRNAHLKTVRNLWKEYAQAMVTHSTFTDTFPIVLSDARIFFGKCAVMSKALGDSPETEHRLGLHKIAKVRLPVPTAIC